MHKWSNYTSYSEYTCCAYSEYSEYLERQRTKCSQYVQYPQYRQNPQILGSTGSMHSQYRTAKYCVSGSIRSTEPRNTASTRSIPQYTSLKYPVVLGRFDLCSFVIVMLAKSQTLSSTVSFNVLPLIPIRVCLVGRRCCVFWCGLYGLNPAPHSTSEGVGT